VRSAGQTSGRWRRTPVGVGVGVGRARLVHGTDQLLSRLELSGNSVINVGTYYVYMPILSIFHVRFCNVCKVSSNYSN
jgi:hypothetical protein